MLLLKRLYIAYLIHRLCELDENNRWFDYSWIEVEQTIKELKSQISFYKKL